MPFKVKFFKKRYGFFVFTFFMTVFFSFYITVNTFSDESKIKDIKGFPENSSGYNTNVKKKPINVETSEDVNHFKPSVIKVNTGTNSGVSNKHNERSIPQLKIVIDKKEIFHYEIQNIYIYDFEGLKPHLFHMKVYYNGSLAPSIGLIEDIPFKIIKKKRVLKAVYLPVWNAKDGFYLVKIYYGDTELKTVNPLTFVIKRRNLKKIKSGFSVVDLEMNKSVNERLIRGISGNIKGPEGILEWASFLNVDALWILSGETTSFLKRKPLKKREYWDEGPIENLKTLEKYANKYNIKIGAYIISFFVPGKNGVPRRYRSGIGYNSKKDYLYKTRHISLSSENRIRDIIDLARDFEKDPFVSYIGFDFIRTGRADGYELVDNFVKDTNIRVSSNWKLLKESDRIKWLARKIEIEKDPIIIEKWRWWRAHKVALIIKRIIKKANITKPVWVYTLGWEHGKEHGQDPIMFFDAGVDIDAVMLYEATHDQYVKMMKQWEDYMSSKQGNIIIGNCVDYKLLDSETLTPPQELYWRNIVGYSELFKDGFTRGLFFHDIYRLLWGRKGSYKSWQYALSFVSSVFNMRQSLGITDILTDIIINRDKEESNTLSGYLYLKNLDEHAVDLYISSYPSGTVEFNNPNSKSNKSRHIMLGLFDIKKIAFRTNNKSVYFHVRIGNKSNYFLPIDYQFQE